MKGFNIKTLFLATAILLISLNLRADLNNNTNAISAKIDSLENLLYNSLSYNYTPNQKIEICTQLAELYKDKSYDKQAEYAARALILSEELGNNELIAKALNILVEAFYKMDNYDKAIEYSTRLYNIYNTSNDEIGAAQALYSIGKSYNGASKYIEAKEYYERALDIYKKNQYFEGIALALRGIASIQLHWGEYNEALNNNEEALKFLEEIGNEEGIAGSYNNIGMVHQEFGNIERAHEYFQKSLEIYKKLGMTWDIVNLTLHIGDIYLKKGMYEKALECYFSAEEIGKQFNNKKLKSIALSNIGEAYNLSGDYIKALKYQQKALKLKLEIGDQKRLAITYMELGVIYNNVEDYKKALENLHTALEITKEINYKSLQSKIYKHLSYSYKNVSKFEKALDNYQLYIDTKEELYSEENTRTIAELQAKYQVEKKDKENERLRHSEQLNKAQIRNQQLIIGFVLFILLGSFILSTIFHSRYQQNQKLNVKLSLKNKEVEDHQENVEKLNKDLQAANAAKDKFFSIVAHDLKNPFNSLLVLTDILIDDYATFSETDKKKFIHQIKSSAENTYSLLQNLLEWASTQSGNTVIVKENVDVTKISEETVSLLKPIARHKNINIETDIPENTVAFADKNMVSTIFLNLISNAVKFTSKEGQVKIQSIQNNGHVEIVVEDSGVGIASKNLNKLFRVDQKLQTEGTDKEKGTGLGLVLCKEFVEKNNGKIWVESEEGKGSKFYFTLPATS